MSATGPQNAFSMSGATELKEKIEAYWRERGAEVIVLIQQCGFHPTLRVARYDVRSDMVDGLPRRRKAA